MPSVVELLQNIINGISLGSLYALIAIGYSMVFGVLQLVNFAHGEMFMLGAYLVMVCLSYGAPWWAALPLAAIGVGLISVIMERVCYKPLRGSGRLAPLITAVGVSLFLQNFVQLVFGPNPQTLTTLMSDEVYMFWNETLLVYRRDIEIFAVAIALALGLEFFIHKTKAGAGIRALAMHGQAARVVGVPVDRTISLTFFIGASLAVVAGCLQGMSTGQIAPTMGVSAGLKAFAAAVLGGIGVIPGAVLGGFVLGIAESLFIGYGLSSYKDGLAFFILILVLLFRPQGLLGKPQLVKV